MRKEKLLEKKQEIMNSAVWYLNDIMTEDEIKMFSRQQLEKLVEITRRAEEKRESSSPFFTLSATEVLQKETGRIAVFEEDCICEESEVECLSGASESIYKEYKRKIAETPFQPLSLES